jgi:hypothetical protein
VRRAYIALSAFAFAVLAFAAVWLGGLNQDEGWYLYAAGLVGEGRMPYRDFFYTQGPLLPCVYSAFSWTWRVGGLLGARILTCLIGLASMILFAAATRIVAPPSRRGAASAAAFMLLGCNLYHVYYTSIPKTYALASLFVAAGIFLVAHALVSAGPRMRVASLFASGLSFAFAAGARISLGALLAVVGFSLLFAFRRFGWGFFWFGLGGALGLAVVYGPYVADPAAFAGLCAAQKYHAARGGFDVVFTVGSLSRLVRWYLPAFILFGLGAACCPRRGEPAPQRPDSFLLGLAIGGFFAVFAVQMLAPFPYEDYQVPVMGLFAMAASVLAARIEWLPQSACALLALGLSWAASFGSPLLEKWTVNGQDRFWSVKKAKCELAQLRDTAKLVEAIDPGGKTLLTQDLYLAIETRRKVPEGLEMGPFSILTDEEWRRLLENCECPVAALSGYTFAIDPPRCTERPLMRQLEYWDLLKKRYSRVCREEAFGQNATTLLILKRRATE